MIWVFSKIVGFGTPKFHYFKPSILEVFPLFLETSISQPSKDLAND